LDALAYAVDAGERIVLLEGSNQIRRSALLLELARRVEPTRKPLLASGDSSRPQGDLIEQIHSLAGLPWATDLHSALALYLERSAVAGRPAVVLVEDAHKFSAGVLQELIQLIERSDGRASAVLAVPERGTLLDALKGGVNFVDLIRLEGRKEEQWPLDARERRRGPGFEPSSLAESGEGVLDSRRTSVSQGLPEPVESEPLAPDPDERLSTIEELLGDAGLVGGARRQVEALPPLSTETTAEHGRRDADDDESPSVASATPAGVGPVDRAISVSITGLTNAAAGVAHEDSGLSHAPAVEEDPRRSVKHCPWLLSALSVLATAIIALSFVVVDRFSYPGPVRLVESTSPKRSSGLGPDSIPFEPPMKFRSDELGADDTLKSMSDFLPAVSNLRNALDVLAMDRPPPEREAAIRFLHDHGPDAEAYDFLAKMGSRPTRTPEDAARSFAAQSRLRRVLCLAWADDPRGEAPVRLGCPNAGSRLR
jgi:hypothetical protein